MSKFTYFRALTLLLLMCFCYACKQEKTSPTLPAFYYWKNHGADDYYTSYNDYMTNKESSFMIDSIEAKRLYIKILDVDWSPINRAYPRSHNTLPEADTIMEYVPTIFITNRVFEQIPDNELTGLADKIVSKCNFSNNSSPLIKEIQIDCDWTNTTQAKYFDFLKIFKKAIGKISLSATIRLYQYRYREKTGVPPVDKGMLMLYNLQDLKRYDIPNSVFDAKEAAAYLDNQPEYPLPLDVALPLFSWAVGYHDGDFVALHNGVSPREADGFSFLKKEKDHYYQVKIDTTFDGHFYRTGDKIKVEYMDATSLQQAAELGKKAIHGKKSYVAFYHLDEKILSRFERKDFLNALKIYNK